MKLLILLDPTMPFIYELKSCIIKHER